MSSEPIGGRLYAIRVWDLPTRLFHWINVLAVLVLIGGGLIVMNLGALGIRPPGALVFKQIHVWSGYILALNLTFRLAWAFVGSPSARWAAFLPAGNGFYKSLRADYQALIAGRANVHVGHSSGGKLAILIMFILLTMLATTGLVLAGTDLYYPPFGGYFANWVAAPGVDPSHVVPYDPDLVVLTAFYEVRDFRRPFIVLHEWAFYVLVGMILVHIASVVLIEVRGGGTLVSAMITGVKILPHESEPELGMSPAKLADRASASVSSHPKPAE